MAPFNKHKREVMFLTFCFLKVVNWLIGERYNTICF